MSPPPGPPREAWLDAFRGLTIAAMILVNNPGSWSAMYPPFRHAEWDGCTPTDLIFPFFLVIAGVSWAVARSRRAAPLEPGPELLRLVRRTLLLVLVGLALNGFPDYDLAALRLPGVLQRIGLACGVAGALRILAGPRASWVPMLLLLGLYHGLMHHWPVPGFGAGHLTPSGSAAAHLDRLLLGGRHLWVRDGWDPEGLLTTIPAVLNVMIGQWAGEIWVRSRDRAGRRLFAAALILVAAGLILDRLHQPINKPLWSPAYAVFTGGQALLGLAMALALARHEAFPRWTQALRAYGRNPLLLFVLTGLLARLLVRVRIHGPDGPQSAKAWIFTHLFAPLAPPELASLLQAIAMLLLVLPLALVLHGRGITVKL
jgi:predicted acyltransferase